MGSSPQVIIIGAGLSGLACARELSLAKVPFVLLEASDAVGGRVRTDIVDGFRLDRGFQVLLTAYPEARRVLNYDALQLKPFFSGSDIFRNGRFHRMADPWRHPITAVLSVFTPIGTLYDKWFALLLRLELSRLRKLPRQTMEVTTEELLETYGFSSNIIDRFFRPFFGGIFLEKELRTSSRVFQFIYAMFAQGVTCIPRLGMQAIPDQMAAGLPLGSIRLNTPVASVAEGSVTLANGEKLQAEHIVIATDENTALKLLNGPEAKLAAQRSVTCLYFTASDPSLPTKPIVYLDGEGRGPVNNAAILSNVSKSYAPAGQQLISATVLGMPGSDSLESAVREHLTRWFGPGVSQWKHVKSYTINNAQPESRQVRTGKYVENPRIGQGLYRCGDHLEDVSINGALLSGRRAAEAILATQTPA
jgi:phytoene dehydrogenase-like protein